jgi:hypothetical protein
MKDNTIYPEHNTMDKESIVLGKSRQGAALLKKTLSYQKRQTFTNICCIRYLLLIISLCPIIMVGLSGFLGVFINGLILRGAAYSGAIIITIRIYVLLKYSWDEPY